MIGEDPPPPASKEGKQFTGGSQVAGSSFKSLHETNFSWENNSWLRSLLQTENVKTHTLNTASPSESHFATLEKWEHSSRAIWHSGVEFAS